MLKQFIRGSALVALGIALVLPTLSAGAEPKNRHVEAEVKIVHLNLGGNGHNKGSTGKPVDELVRHVVEEDADLISLNEMCLTQWLATAERLSTHPGYEGLYAQYAVTNTKVPNCTDAKVDPQGRYVLGIMSKHPGQPVMFGDVPYLDLGYHYMSTSIPRLRKMPCADVELPVGETVRFCTTHTEVANIRVNETTTKDPSIVDDPYYGHTMNDAQAARIAEAIAPWRKDHALILAGDFNTEPWHSTLDRFYQRGGNGYLVEVDSENPDNRGKVEKFPAGGWWPAITASNPARRGQPTVELGAERQPCENFGDLCKDWVPGDIVPFTGARKIDYIFVNPRFFDVAPDSARIEETPYADHLYLYGTVTIK